MSSHKNPLFRWFDALSRTRESTSHDPMVALWFALFVGGVRLSEEILLVGFHHDNLLEQFLLGVTFYWSSFYVFAVALHIAIPGEWRRTINIVLVGLFLGIFPPIIDIIHSGWGGVEMFQSGFSYQYIPGFPGEWPIGLYHPNEGIPLGEAITLWMIVGFMGLYAFARTGKWWRGLLGSVTGYAGVCMIAGVLPTIGIDLLSHPPFSNTLTMIAVQLCSAMGLYLLVFRFQTSIHLLKRSVHLVPLMAVCVLGWRWHHPLYPWIVVAIAMVWLLGVFALVQNEYFDAEDDEGHREKAPVVAGDVVMLAVTVVGLALALLSNEFIEGIAVVVFIAVSYLYNAPPYRGKRYFPSGYKLEGAWGGAAFALGALPAIRLALKPLAHELLVPAGWARPYAQSFGASGLVLLVLVIGGWSVMAMTKDFKDIEADQEAGVTTIYTLLIRRGWSAVSVHRLVSILVAICLVIGLLLAFSVDATGVSMLIAVIATAGMLWMLLKTSFVRDYYGGFLILLSVYLFALALGVPAGFAGLGAS